MEHFQIISEIGEGSFAKVYKAINKDKKEMVAIKKLKHKLDDVLNLREVKFMRKINHPNIIKMKEIITQKEDCHLVFEYMHDNLLNYYQKNTLLEQEIKQIIFYCLKALNHLHQNGLFHRDLKPENILVSKNCVKLCDFGLVREIRSRPPYTEYVSTRWYRSPEILLHSQNYNSPVDIFAMGCIMVELFSRNPLFKGQSEIDQLNKTLQILGTPSQQQWPEGYRLAKQLRFQLPQFEATKLEFSDMPKQALELLKEMLQVDPSLRSSANKLLQNKYFDDIRHTQVQLQIQEQRQPEPFAEIKKHQRNISQHQNQHLDNQQKPMFFEQKTNRNAHKINQENRKFFQNPVVKPTYAFH